MQRRCSPRLTILLVVVSASLTLACRQAASATGRVLDVQGHPLPRGTQLEGSFEHPDVAGYNRQVEAVIVEGDGRIRLRQRPRLGRTFIWLQRTKADGSRSRVFQGLRGEDAGTLQLEPEVLLARGRVIDESGRPLRRHAVHLGVGPPPSLRGTMAPCWLGARWVHEDGYYELHGWPVDGEWTLNSSYRYHGPAGRPVPLEQGREDLTITLPDTGNLRVQVTFPDSFPSNGLRAIIRNSASERVIQRTISPPSQSGGTHVRFHVGRYHVSYEVNGEMVADLGEFTVRHGKTTDLPVHDLRPRVRLIRVEVLDEARTPLRSARVHVLGTPEGLEYTRERNRRSGKWEIFVPVTTPAVDLEVSVLGDDHLPKLIRDVAGSIEVVLERAPSDR